MRVRHSVLISSAVLALGAGAGVAVAASGGGDGKQAEDTILTDAAKRLNVTPERLRSALGAAEDAQLDQAVKDGRLTQAQANAIKRHRQQDGRVLGFGHGPGGPGFGPGGPGMGRGPLGAGLDAAASALGLTRAQLLQQLRDGKSLADVAKAKGKATADVKTAIEDAVTKQLDAAVTAGRMTAQQRQDALAELREHLDDLVTRALPPMGGPPRGGMPGGPMMERGWHHG